MRTNITAIFLGLATLTLTAGCGKCDYTLDADEVDETMDELGMEYANDCMVVGYFTAGEYVVGYDTYGNAIWDSYISSVPELVCDNVTVTTVVVTFAGEYFFIGGGDEYQPEYLSMTVSYDDVSYEVGEYEEYGSFSGNMTLVATIWMDSMWMNHPVTFWYLDETSDTIMGAVSMQITECEYIHDEEIRCEYEEVKVTLQ